MIKVLESGKCESCKFFRPAFLKSGKMIQICSNFMYDEVGGQYFVEVLSKESCDAYEVNNIYDGLISDKIERESK